MKNFAYLVGPEDSEEVAVIDPAWEVSRLAQVAKESGKRIAAAVVSHCHGDHINGIPDLLAQGDIPVYAQGAEVDFSPELRQLGGDALRKKGPGDEVQLGSLRLKLLHTPGHTPGSQCIQVADSLVSGDTLFVNACGRCDLRGGNPEEMYRSISSVLLNLPRSTVLLPGHDYGDLPTSSLAREAEHNPYFQFHDLASFVAFRMRPRS